MERLHLAVNHFPIALVVVGAGAELLGAVLRRQGPRRMGAVLLLLGAVGAVGAYLTGSVAEEIVEELPGISHEAVETHEEWGLVTTLLVVGVAAFRWLVRRRLSEGWGAVALVLVVVAAAAVVYTGYLGGEIFHGTGAGPGTPAGEEAAGFGLPAPSPASLPGAASRAPCAGGGGGG